MANTPASETSALVLYNTALRPNLPLLPAMPLRFRVAGLSDAGLGDWSEVIDTTILRARLRLRR